LTSTPGKFVNKQNLTLVATSLIVSILASEGLIRFFQLSPDVTQLDISTPWGSFVGSENKILKYVPKAGAGDINQLGFRDHEYSIQKPKDVYRIVVIGDSIAFGYCNNEEPLSLNSTFSKLLEAKLNKIRPFGYSRIEVLNMGVSGYHTLQEAEFLRTKGLAFNPDLVIVAYCLNDSWNASAELGQLKEKLGGSRLGRPTTRWLGEAFHHSALIRFVWQRSSIIIGKTKRGPKPDFPAEGFRKIRKMADEQRFGVLVVIFPLFDGFKNYKWSKDHEAASQKAQSNNFEILDLLPSFKKVSGDDPKKFQGRCNREHPDEVGHLLAAVEIEKEVRAKFLGAK
jgi:hypothetical protein